MHLHIVDLADAASVRTFASNFGSSTPVHALVLNAGVLVPGQRQVTPNGYEVGLATMVNQSYLLTGLLLPNLVAAGTPSNPARIVHVSSGGGLTVKAAVDDLNCEKRAYDGTLQYAHVKRCQILLSDYIADQLSKNGVRNVVSHSMHPGWAATPGVQSSIPEFFEKNKDTLRSSDEGSDTIAWLAAGKSVADTKKVPSGGFWFDRARAERHYPMAWTQSSAADVQKLLAVCEKMTSGYKLTDALKQQTSSSTARQ